MLAPDTPDADVAHTDAAATSETWAVRNYRSLKIAVIVMSVLIVLGLILVFGAIAYRMSGGGSSAEAPPVAVVVPDDVARLLGADGEIVSTAVYGSRMAIVVKRPEGHAVIVVDLRSGRVLNVISGDTKP
jgi:hypothetical protein